MSEFEIETKTALLTAEQLSKLFKLDRNTIYRWVSRNEIPCVKLPGGTTRFLVCEIEAWLRKQSMPNGELSTTSV